MFSDFSLIIIFLFAPFVPSIYIDQGLYSPTLPFTESFNPHQCLLCSKCYHTLCILSTSPPTPSHDTSLQSQIIGLRKYYWLSKWNLFDFAITIVSVLDTTVLDITVPSIKGINPSIIRIVRLVRILRIVRAGRLVKVCMGA